MRETIAFLGLLIIILLTSCAVEEEEKNELRISAASSLTNVLTEVQQEFETNNPNFNLIINYASSGTIATQLKQGAPMDVVFLASIDWMNDVNDAGLIEASSVRNIIENQMVLIGEGNKVVSVQDLLTEDIKQFATGDPKSVPAGRYTMELLKSYGILKQIESKAVYGKNVRQVAAYVQSGNVDAGFVYLSDVTALKGLKIIEKIDTNQHSPILYQAGITKTSEQKEKAQLFLDFLLSKRTSEIFNEFGFKSRK